MTSKKNIFPKKLRLLGEDYKIVIIDFGETGSIDYKKKTISIHSYQNDDERIKTLWHELGHYFCDYYSIRRVLENDEIFCEAFAKFICSINKQLYQSSK